MTHTPVMLNEVIFYLSPKPLERYLDCTFGAGGYSRKILESIDNSQVIAIDQDPRVESIANEFKKEFGERFNFIQGNFSNIQKLVEPFGKMDGIIWDLGVSSMQLDDSKRGFSFSKDSKLDMRMSQDGYSAFDFVNMASQEEIANVIFYNGGEIKAKQIARQIIEARLKEPINTTFQLAAIIRKTVNRYHTKIDPATKTFQAIRIFVNDELKAFEKSLVSAEKVINKGGRIVVLSFHSLEDKIIKDYLKTCSEAKIARSKYFVPTFEEREKKEVIYEILTRKPITPLFQETKNNPRARSAKLRAARKL